MHTGCIIYLQEYRSGHNEAVLKTVRPKATGVRIPLPAPKQKDTHSGVLLLWHRKSQTRTTLRQEQGFAYPERRSKSSLFRRRGRVFSLCENSGFPILVMGIFIWWREALALEQALAYASAAGSHTPPEDRRARSARTPAF